MIQKIADFVRENWLHNMIQIDCNQLQIEQEQNVYEIEQNAFQIMNKIP